MISEFVEYVKQVWKNKPNVNSPLNADRLNHMEAGIENNSKKIKETVTAVNELTEKTGNCFKDKGVLKISADSITENGAYRVIEEHAVNNVTNGILVSFIAFADASVAFQLLTNYNTSFLYVRSKWYGKWNDWNQIK